MDVDIKISKRSKTFQPNGASSKLGRFVGQVKTPQAQLINLTHLRQLELSRPISTSSILHFRLPHLDIRNCCCFCYIQLTLRYELSIASTISSRCNETDRFRHPTIHIHTTHHGGSSSGYSRERLHHHCCFKGCNERPYRSQSHR